MSGLLYIILCQNQSKDITKNLEELDVTVDIPLVSFSMPMQTSKLHTKFQQTWHIFYGLIAREISENYFKIQVELILITNAVWGNHPKAKMFDIGSDSNLNTIIP